MIKVDLSKAPPEGACILAYYTGTDFSPAGNVGLKDMSFLWAENRTGRDNQSYVVEHSGGTLELFSSPEVAITCFSITNRDVPEPIPLFWGFEIGAENDFGGERHYIYAPEATGLSTSTARQQIEQILTSKVRLLEADGSESSMPFQALIQPATGITGTPPTDGFRAWIGLPQPTSPGRPLFVQYQAISHSGSVVENRLEIVSTQEMFYHLFDAVDVNGAVATPGEWGINVNDDNTYSIEVNTFAYETDAIALWVDEAGWTWATNAGTLTITDGTPSNITLANKTVREVVQEINALNRPVRATLLADYHNAADLIDTSAATRTITAFGDRPITLPNHVHIHIPSDTVIYLKKPKQLSRSEEWHPILHIPPVRHQNVPPNWSGYTVSYSGTESNWLPFSGVITGEYLESYKEVPNLLRGDLLSLQNGHIEPRSVRLLVNDHDATHLIRGYDEWAGLLWLSIDVLSADSVEVTYSYRRGYDIPLNFLNLNPGQYHRTEFYRLYVGVYITPNRFEHASSTDYDLKPTIGYVVGNTISEVTAAIDALTHAPTGYELMAECIGIFQISSQGDATDIKILDVRSNGGGIVEGADMEQIVRDNPEAQFYWDIGYWEGEPYAGSGVIIVHGDRAILGTDRTIPSLVGPPDGGFVDLTGRESPEELRRRIQRHITAGMYPVLDLE